MAEKVRANLIIHGKVQGVFFRDSTRQKAQELGLEGWVKNLPLQRVEAVFQGPADKVQEAIDWAHQGPPAARVTKVDLRWQDPADDLGGFQVRR
jgi:acylphosphatase